MSDDLEDDKEGQEESKDEGLSRDYVTRWIHNAKEKADPWRELVSKAYREYEAKDNGSILGRKSSTKARYPIYWMSCKVLEPHYFSRLPNITTEREFEINDESANTQCVIAERLGKYLIKNSNLREAMEAARSDFIHGSKAALQALYSAEMETVENRIPLMPQQFADSEEMVFLSADGMPYDDEVFQDAQGFFGKEVVEQAIEETQELTLAALPYDEYLHTPSAKVQSEIKEEAYFFSLTEEEAEDRFGEEICGKVNWKVESLKKEDKENDEKKGLLTKYLEGYEFYCKKSKKVYWWSDQYIDGFLDVKDDPLGIRKFFPRTDYIIDNKPAKSLFPTPVYKQLESQIDEMHDLARRIKRLTKSIRRKILIDGSSKELEAALNSIDEGDYTVCPNLQGILEKGGIKNMIFVVPVQELVQSLNELTNLKEVFKTEFFEGIGVPDVLRGVSDPNEPLGTQEIKAGAGGDRFKLNKLAMVRLANDGINLLIDLALKVYSDDKIKRIVGFRYLPQDDQMRFDQALAELRDDTERYIRIEIESDSMSFVDEQLRAQQMANAVDAVTRGIDMATKAAQTSPKMAGVALSAVLYSLETLAFGKQFQDGMKGALEGLVEELQNPPQPPPPPPDYEGMKLQLQSQELQFKAMQEQNKTALLSAKQASEADRSMKELQIKGYELQLKQANQQNSNLHEQVALSLQQYKVQVEESHSAAKIQMEQMKANFEQQVQQAMLAIEERDIRLQEFEAQIRAQERMMEEVRLAKEVDHQALGMALEAQVANQQSFKMPEIVVQPPNVVVNVTPQRSKRKLGRITFDEQDNATFELDDDPIEALVETLVDGK